jgi:hypothetical protein
MTASTLAEAPRGAVRSALRARLAAVAPAGIIWLEAAGLAHPEAARALRLPFPFVIGRVAAAGGGKRTVREAELVLTALDPGEDDEAALTAYARFVVASAPTIHARLTGRTLTAWREAEAA